MNINEKYTVKIEKMINEGLGLAKIDGMPVFIDNSCPEDVLKVKITKINKNFLNAEIIEITEPSKYRIKPECSLSNVCGSCNWQHIDYNEQLRQKQKIVKETIKSIAGIDVDVKPTIPSPKISEYRCKVQMPVSQTKVSKRILSGYYKKKSHELINIKYCQMQPNIINEISEYIKIKAQELNISGYNEKNHTGILRHIIYRISSDYSKVLIIFVLNSNKIDNKICKLAEELNKKYTVITGICANLNDNRTNVILGNKTICIKGNDFYIEKLNNISYKISASSFFQINPYCAAEIFNTVKKLISDKITNPVILDAYSGVSSFGIWLSSVSKKVISIEEVKSASENAIENSRLNNINNLEVINGDAEIEFSKLIKNNIKFDVSIIDPPRKGCSVESISNLAALTSKYIIYISCNPATFARDLKILVNKGFMPEYVQPADMFPNTYHIETIALLKKLF